MVLAALCLSPVVRALGAELGRPLSARAQPVDAPAEQRALLFLAAIEQAPLALGALIGGWVAGGPLTGVLALLATTVGLAVFQWLLVTVGVRHAPRIDAVAWSLRAGLVLVALGLGAGGLL